jgi:Raf kinase inhibitor-like YbhB/YbcL family protein
MTANRFLMVSCAAAVLPYASNRPGGDPLRLWSDDFRHNGPIPRVHTCQGEEVSPGLSWTAGPEGTRSYCLIVTDADAPIPGVTITHWVLYNIPAGTTSIHRGVTAEQLLRDGMLQGRRFAGRRNYLGPCPPFGKHRYFFRLYALDTMLDLTPENATRRQLLKAMAEHIVGFGEIAGVYWRQ